ncbi:CBF1-interacting co-repressor CIR [Prunus dulcis]|uniref:CBF1-interacting co-repressor CIR n=1 Tax=Prunus dulcis TaxID=3755 RepID=A0A4Y1QNF0_PRUDU|nr:CBF1-interacting co-repressor CIR [Prunus dulcis]
MVICLSLGRITCSDAELYKKDSDLLAQSFREVLMMKTYFESGPKDITGDKDGEGQRPPRIKLRGRETARLKLKLIVLNSTFSRRRRRRRMALKFLNKKGWHTGSLRNIENVWKAEQKHEAEQKKLDELRKQIVEERERSEFRLLQEQAGLVPRQERLEFLYDSGLAVGRPGGSDSFKTLEALPKTEEAPSSSAASKQQASASVPGALFEEKPQSANDAWRKLHSDPLLMIRQREQEALSRIKNNPVHMAMIRKSVEAKKPAEKLHEKKEHQKKQHHTGASKHSKHSSSIQTSDSGNDTAEVERRKSGHRQISKYVKHSDSEDESCKRARRRENTVKHSDSEDESPHRSGKNPVKHSDSEDETRYRAQRSEKNHVKHSDSEDESRKRLGRSGKNLVKRSHLEDESRNRARRGGKNQSIKIGRDDDQGDAKGKHDNLELEKYPMKGRNESHYKRRNVAPKLSEEERAARLKEMQIDAELHEEQRWKRLKRPRRMMHWKLPRLSNPVAGTSWMLFKLVFMVLRGRKLNN